MPNNSTMRYFGSDRLVKPEILWRFLWLENDDQFIELGQITVLRDHFQMSADTFGLPSKQTSTESLILAQDERWRRA